MAWLGFGGGGGLGRGFFFPENTDRALLFLEVQFHEFPTQFLNIVP